MSRHETGLSVTKDPALRPCSPSVRLTEVKRKRLNRSHAKWLSYLGFFGTFLVATSIFFFQKPNEEEQAQLRLKRNLEHRIKIAEALREPLSRLEFPEELTVDLEDGRIDARATYTLDPDLQAQADKLLQRYRPDYGAVFMMDAKTGRVLAFSSFQRDSKTPVNLITRATYPAASTFKIVTASAAIDGKGLSPSYKIRFNGGNYTLYKKNVLSDRINRWTRTITLRDAFARSYNTAFGRLSLENLKPEDINEYATRFMFNQEIPADFPVDMGIATVPAEKGFELTEVASGYTKNNRMSPVQGAMIAATIVNDGRMVMPYVVDKLIDSNGKEIHTGETIDNGAVISTDSALDLRELMEATVISGTSRKSFRPLVRGKKYRELEFGGKTGHLTGDNPRGRVDWFIGYGQDENRRIAIAALTVNKEFWTVKSAELAKQLFHRSFESAQADEPAPKKSRRGKRTASAHSREN